MAALFLGLLIGFTSSAQTYQLLHAFNNNDGDGLHLYGGVVLGGATLYGTARDGGTGGSGTLYQVNTDGTGFAVLHSFSGSTTDGAEPQASMLLAGDTLYGTTAGGGLYGYGTVFSINTNGTGFAILHSFTNFAGPYPYTGSDGGAPYAALTLSGDTLYGTTTSGGNYFAAGTVFAINTNGSGYRQLLIFPINYTTNRPVADLVLSGNTLYGTTYDAAGGDLVDPPWGEVFKVNTDGSDFAGLKAFPPVATDPSNLAKTNSDGLRPATGLVLSGTTLYGTTQYGGARGYGTLFTLTTGGAGFTVLHSFIGGAADGATPLGDLVVAGNALCGTTQGGGLGAGTVFKVNTNGSGFTLLHSFGSVAHDAGSPLAGLYRSGRTLYGTGEAGAYDDGAVFSLTLPMPALAVSLSDAGPVVFWPDDGLTYTLLTTTNLSSAGWTPVPLNWTNNAVSPVLIGYQTGAPPGSTAAFFKLQ